LAEISGLKREGVSPEDFLIAQEAEEKAIAENEDTYHSKGAHKGKMKKIYADQLLKIKKNKELAFVYEVYEKNLHEKRLMDYEDIIVEFISALKRDADFTLMLQEQYQYILADEHQDANQSQNTILELLSAFHENPNIFVVGDEKQAIYRFQGASLANFLYFKELYPTATLLSLKNNYRSTQHILDASHSLILHNAVYDEKLQVELVSHSEHDNTPIALYDFDDEHTELHYITAHIQKRIEDGVDSREIAVLVRENNDTFKVARYLEHKNIPFQNLSSENLLQDPLIAGLVYVLKSIIDPLNDVWFARALHTDIVGIDPLSAHKMITYAKKKRIPMYEVFARLSEFQSGSDGKELKSISIDAQKESFAEWVRMSSNETALTILSSLIEKSTYLKKVSMGGNGISAISKIKTFLDFAESVLRRRSNNGLAVLLDELVTMETYNISIPFSGSELRDGVRIMTGHKSKGREYEFVYVPFLRDGYWGGKRKRNKFSISVGVSINLPDELLKSSSQPITRIVKDRIRAAIRLIDDFIGFD